MIRTLCLFTALFCSVAIAAEPSWTVFHGQNQDNVSTETGLLKTWKEGGPPLHWKNDEIGNTEFPGYAGVTVAEGRVFTAGNVKTGNSDQNAKSVVFALDEKTGKEIWHYANGRAWVDKRHFPGERSTPTIDGNRVYAFSSFGFLACIEAATGKEIWSKNIRDEYEAKLPTWAYAESPVVDGDKVVCWIGGEKAAACALDKMTGKTIWETPSTGAVGNYATMCVFDYADRRIYVNMNQTGFLAVDAKTGEQLFAGPHKTEWDVMATMPYFFDGKLSITSGYGTGSKLYKLNVNGKTITPEEIWAKPEFDNMHGGVVIKDGYAYTATHYYKKGRNWMCIKLEDASTAWENPGVGMGAITCADGMLYCTSEKEPYEVALVKATPEKYEETGRFELPAEEEEGGVGMFWAHPVVCNKKLYLRHGTILYCYDVAEK
ncbi:MAG: PQQ-like beta-propeller repeat protein [Planctomycetaceae bacterium]|jgi:outer membrane protein assembly factor BamB|nr:PQQ-like beta-propeller repeat protein [Planctomycetaceae bacterium]